LKILGHSDGSENECEREKSEVRLGKAWLKADLGVGTVHRYNMNMWQIR
jgi:hypothetical protein